MEKVLNIVIKLIFIAVTAVIFYYLLQRIDKYLLLKAVNECGQNTSVSYETEAGATVTEPYKPAYDQCLKDKGIY